MSAAVEACPYLGPGALRAVITAIGREADDRGSSCAPELVADIAACEGRDFAAGWLLERMPRDRAVVMTARVVAYLAGAARLSAAALAFLAEVPELGRDALLERLEQPRANGPALSESRDPRDVFTLYAGFALSEEPRTGELDDCMRDVFRGYARIAMCEGVGLDALDVALDIIRGETAEPGTPREL